MGNKCTYVMAYYGALVEMMKVVSISNVERTPKWKRMKWKDGAV